MEESEQNPPEGYKKNPKPVTPKPGAAQIWLASLHTKKEGEKEYGIAEGIRNISAFVMNQPAQQQGQWQTATTYRGINSSINKQQQQQQQQLT